ncbi:MAG: hypothetical protein ACI8PB_003047 [Desulforhopalus sp.]|jgi:hypothetical protein
MRSLQEQYNLVPGQYAKEMASVSVLPHLKSIAKELATYFIKPSSISNNKIK